MKSITLSSIAAFGVLIAVMAGSALAQPCTIQAGDRILFYGKPVTEQWVKAWAAGVNLAPLETPRREQAQKVLDLTTLRSDTDFTTWRDFAHKLKDYPRSKEASEAPARAVQQIQDPQRRTALPVEHQYQLTLVTTN